ncbi:MAG: rod shape-determining protein MreC [Oscillospiraceae bacterium]|nr:rod shape-determining protein MreC [Oscillospiraceae bacterium]
MKKHLSAKAKWLIVISVLLAGVLTVTAAMKTGGWGQKLVQTVLTPFRSASSALVRQVERYYDYVFKYESLQAENQALKAQIVAMEEDVRSADSLQRENERLQQLLGLAAEHEDYHFASAYIIAWEDSSWKSAFTIGKGTNSGIHEGLVAVTEYGQVVGLVTAAGPNWATITTVLDSALSISATVASTGYNGVVEGALATGSEGQLRMNYLPTDSVLRNNDQVLTTGSTVYPRGLIIGYITDANFDQTGVAKYALLKPAADLDDLEQIFIITEFNNS